MRKSRVLKPHNVKPDPVFKDLTVSKFANYLMKDGKKLVAYKILYKTLGMVGDRTKKEGLDVFKEAIKNAAPSVEIKRRRVGGSTAQVPVEIRKNRADFLSMTWIIKNASNRSEKTMALKLTNEIIDTYNGEGTTIKKKEDVHKMASSNKFFVPVKVK